MKKLIFIFLMAFPFLGACAHDQSGADSRNALYHSNILDLDYDWKSVCDFADDYLSLKHLSSGELSDFQQKKYTKVFPLQDLLVINHYAHDGIEIDYKIEDDGSMFIMQASYEAYRLPTKLHSKSFYITEFKAQPKQKILQSDHIELRCDVTAIEANFEGNTLKNLTAESYLD